MQPRDQVRIVIRDAKDQPFEVAAIVKIASLHDQDNRLCHVACVPVFIVYDLAQFLDCLADTQPLRFNFGSFTPLLQTDNNGHIHSLAREGAGTGNCCGPADDQRTIDMLGSSARRVHAAQGIAPGPATRMKGLSCRPPARTRTAPAMVALSRAAAA